MLYQSTRGSMAKVTASKAIAHGMAEDGGLFVPESFPEISLNRIVELSKMQYKERAAYTIGLFLDDYSSDEICKFANQAYSTPGFDHPGIAPLHKLEKYTHFLELWHGPTCAFKDMALQMLPHLLTASLKKTNEAREVCILVATSGDTGKAALEGFRDVPGIRIMVFYPRDGVSEVQKLQMVSQEGGNVAVTAVEGNFDDAQTGVKAIFSDESLRRRLSEAGFILSSANSINWGRLVPQIVYYVSAYCDLITSGEIIPGEKVHFSVPSGNFGNILAAYYAKKIGLPIGRLICASNRNDVLAQFIDTGIYDTNRPFYNTVSPSMDILVSSNLERLLFAVSGNDGRVVTDLMSALSSSGRYVVSNSIQNEIRGVFSAARCSEEDTMKAIREVYDAYSYIIDTHTAVAYKALCEYRGLTGDDTTAVVVSTASPFKFCESVLESLGWPSSNKGVALLEELQEATGIQAPAPLRSLKDRLPRFDESVPKDGMIDAVMRFLV